MCCVFFFQAEDGIRDLVRSRGLGDVYKRQVIILSSILCIIKRSVMKKTILPLLLFIFTNISFSQNYKITWGEEIKLKKGTADLDIIMADNTGLYFTEERRGGVMLSLGGGSVNYKLYKFDKNFVEIFDKEYKKELKGLTFQSFQAIGSNLYLFATDYFKKERAYKIYGAKVDKNSGELIGDFDELGSYELENKKDDYEMKVSPVHNGSEFLMVSNISAKDRVSIAVALLDKSLKRKESAVINLSFIVEQLFSSNIHNRIPDKRCRRNIK